jgi:hypothetical protein
LTTTLTLNQQIDWAENIVQVLRAAKSDTVSDTPTDPELQADITKRRQSTVINMSLKLLESQTSTSWVDTYLLLRKETMNISREDKLDMYAYYALELSERLFDRGISWERLGELVTQADGTYAKLKQLLHEELRPTREVAP